MYSITSNSKVIYLEPMEDGAKGKICVYMCVCFGIKGGGEEGKGKKEEEK